MGQKITLSFNEAMSVLRCVPGTTARMLPPCKYQSHVVKFDTIQINREGTTRHEKTYLWSFNDKHWDVYRFSAPLSAEGEPDFEMFDAKWEVDVPDEFVNKAFAMFQKVLPTLKTKLDNPTQETPFNPEGTRFEFLFKQIERFTKWIGHMSYNDSYFGEPEGELKRIAHELDCDIANLRSGRK